jgi:hypothetical protein
MMIYQLIKRDPAWKLALTLAAATAVLSTWMLRYRMSILIPDLWFTFFISTILSLRPHHRCTLFEAALPIDGRQLFCARLLSMLAAIWLPALSVVACVFTFGQNQRRIVALTTVAIAAAVTAAMCIVQSVRVREFSAPLWVFIVTMSVGYLAVRIVSVVLPFSYITLTAELLICACVSSALLFVTWIDIPRSFQVAAPGPVASKASAMKSHQGHARENRRPSFILVWLPAYRSMFNWLPLLYFFLVLGYSAEGKWVFASLWSLSIFSWALHRLRWISTLPISQRTVFLTLLFLSIVPQLAGCLLRSLLGSRPDELAFIVATAMTAVTLLLMIAVQIPLWARLWHVPKVVRLAPVLLILGAWLLLFLSTFSKDRADRKVLVWLVGVLPANPVLAATFVTAVLAVLCSIAYKQFCQIEPPAQAQQTIAGVSL